MQPRFELAFYTAANGLHYPGLVALVNSLRLVGETSPIVVVDCGFTRRQRKTLEPHVTFVAPHNGLHPTLQKATGPMEHPAEHMILLDADVLVTRPLAPLVEEVPPGGVVAFVDFNSPDRFFPEWEDLGLGSPRRLPYVNAGHLVLSATAASELLPQLVELQAHLDMTDSFVGTRLDPSRPLYYADQDLLNAIFTTTFDARVSRLERRLAPLPPFTGLVVKDVERLRCAYDDGVGHTCFITHFKSHGSFP